MIFREEKLLGVHPLLVDVVRKAATLTPHDLLVGEGVRSKARQAALFAQGRTAPGKVVTWTLNSKHCPQADGFGHAVDLYVQKDRKMVATTESATEVKRAMFLAAKALGVRIRWGADWDQDGVPWEKGEYDGPHFELVSPPIVAPARVAA